MSKVRQRILDVATALFYRQGIQAVGVDAIIGTADVARMSFYRHFRSKEGLALAVLERSDERLCAWFEQEVERLAPDAKLRPLAVFDALAMRLASPDYRGCTFLNTIAETPSPSHALHRAAAAHKRRFEAYFARLLRAGGLDESASGDLMLLFDGAVVTAVREGNPTPATRAKRIAARVLGIAPAN
jgi:AcrR family transcriptional regulator